MKQPCVYTHAPPLRPLTHHPNRSLWVITEHWSELSLLCFVAFLAIYFTPGGVYMLIPISQFVPLSHFPHAHMSILYICIFIRALEIGSSVPFS